LQLDDLWTAAAQAHSSANNDVQTSQSREIGGLVRDMTESLALLGESVETLREAAVGCSQEGESCLNELLWSTELRDEDRADLRWLTLRHGGFQGISTTAIATLSTCQSEIDQLRRQSVAMGIGNAVAGDLTRQFRCGLGMALISSAIMSLQTTAVAAVSVASAGALIATTGGVGAIAILVAGLLVIRNSRC
jgi:hypothetical protein